MEDAVAAAGRFQEAVMADVPMADVAGNVGLPVECEGRLARNQAAGWLRAVTFPRSLLLCWSPLGRVRRRRPCVAAHEALAERSKRIVVHVVH